ncbi:hypothetical protein [Granulosicoccus antarcticus]|uniref:Uncharacterized protein n=1 Tax=Granulosicoccus antarcticus IMCC3135 TaxID=1192854 RepID=A0A2Z2NYD3_9GAMM|nr:hypothetical protein [Granulosicoccus antarcticus]ASJ76319.1 hypothetical protein IMCC3135_31355 [Granulosicoccus antarcticus IMCC3135]
MIARIIAAAVLCASTSVSSLYAQEASFSTGLASQIKPGLIDCGPGSRLSAVGEIRSNENTMRTVPAATNFESAPKASDLFNECGGTRLLSISQLDLQSVPVLDAGGVEEFVMYLFADNYFELYINGQLLAVDPVPFTPLNSSVVRFKADRPLTIAVMAVDWEENLGLGSENDGDKAFQPGNGGFVAHLQDLAKNTVTITNRRWRAQTFYTSPLQNRDCLVASRQIRRSTPCDDRGVDNADGFSAAYWDLPLDWMMPSFDDRSWPSASSYSNKAVGVESKKAFTNFRDVFDTEGADADFIWTSNLILDNLVILRKTVE